MTYEQEQLLIQAAQADSVYQDLLKNCLSAEADYLRIRSGLSREDQEILDRYISLCEELEYRRTCLALTLK